MPRGGPVGERTLCWDCERACCGCSWSRNFEPVVGWKARPVNIKQRGAQTTGSFIVYECPGFKRDAIDYGMKWAYKPNEIIHRNYNKKSQGDQK